MGVVSLCHSPTRHNIISVQASTKTNRPLKSYQLSMNAESRAFCSGHVAVNGNHAVTQIRSLSFPWGLHKETCRITPVLQPTCSIVYAFTPQAGLGRPSKPFAWEERLRLFKLALKHDSQRATEKQNLLSMCQWR